MESSSRRCAFTVMMSLTLAACSKAESPPTGSKSYKSVGWNPLTCPTSNPQIYPFESGTGGFRFYANVRSFYTSTRSASTDWDPSPPVKAYIRRILHKMSIAAYLATEGRFLIDHWTIHWNQGGLWVTFPFQRSQTGASQCSRSGSNPGSTCWTSNDGIVQLNAQNWCFQSSINCVPVDTPSCPCLGSEARAEEAASSTLLHEFGHCDWPFGLRDEYLSYNQCGHSLMADEWKGYEANTTDFCNYYNGGEDAEVGHSKEENNWACFASRLYLGNPVVPAVDTAITRMLSTD